MSGLELTVNELNDWEGFWDKEITVTGGKMNAFSRNYAIMRRLISDRFGTIRGKTSLEVGCGRGIMSKFLQSDGLVTAGMDTMLRFADYNRGFIHGSILDLEKIINRKGQYDVVFTYGLLEHWSIYDSRTIMANCEWMTAEGGITIHYVVPRKWANWNENRDVYRGDCKHLYEKNMKWVYPCLPGCAWETNSILGKGFFIWQMKVQ